MYNKYNLLGKKVVLVRVLVFHLGLLFPNVGYLSNSQSGSHCFKEQVLLAYMVLASDETLINW